MIYTSKSTDETRKIAEEFISNLSPRLTGTVVALEGDLGSGKTTFSQCVGGYLGVRDPIQSPTFLIEKIYELHRARWKHLIHIDAYRLDHEEELISLGWREIISKPENLILVEWAERVSGILPQDCIRIKFTFIDENTRQIEIL